MWCNKPGTSLHKLFIMTDLMCCCCISIYSCNVDYILVTTVEKTCLPLHRLMSTMIPLFC